MAFWAASPIDPSVGREISSCGGPGDGYHSNHRMVDINTVVNR